MRVIVTDQELPWRRWSCAPEMRSVEESLELEFAPRHFSAIFLTPRQIARLRSQQQQAHRHPSCARVVPSRICCVLMAERAHERCADTASMTASSPTLTQDRHTRNEQSMKEAGVGGALRRTETLEEQIALLASRSSSLAVATSKFLFS